MHLSYFGQVARIEKKIFNELRPNQSIRVSRDLRSLFALTLPNYQMAALLPRIFDRWFALLTVR